MVNIGLWKEKNLFLVQVRDYRLGYNNMHLSEPKGIALTLEVWRTFFENIQDINDDVEELASKYDADGMQDPQNASYSSSFSNYSGGYGGSYYKKGYLF